ncbi:hypothetical protein [Thermococcus sp.]|uniref:hypothetical protein n=1 Tax=Thermococcus sp. TaxID=35749 RepID=UPI00260A8BC3|nr:hypothetical protein [Thermococcus sp.]
MIPGEFISYAFEERVEGIKKLADGEFGPEALIGFTRHNAAVITCGKAGVNGSIKGIGFIHRRGVSFRDHQEAKRRAWKALQP